MTTQISKRLKEFIVNQRWEYDFPLTEEKRLYQDLGIYGDDAIDFLDAFCKEFSVDGSKFEPAKYFKGEGGTTLSSIFDFFRGKKAEEKYHVLTIGDLERAIAVGKLDSTVIKDK